jgi:hypothetical protein
MAVTNSNNFGTAFRAKEALAGPTTRQNHSWQHLPGHSGTHRKPNSGVDDTLPASHHPFRDAAADLQVSPVSW